MESIEDLLSQLHDERQARRAAEARLLAAEDALGAAQEQARRADRLRAEFLANVSHEIRTPLSIIVGYTEMLLENAAVSADDRKTIRAIVRNSRHLLRVIEDILDLSKLEAQGGSLEAVPFSPHQLAHDVHEFLGLRAREIGLTFDVDVVWPLPAHVVSDPARIRQILLNLGSNAIKFTAQGGIRLQVACDRTNEQLTFRVSDTGIGMSPEQLDLIFDPFTQADASISRRFGGTGLGLSISQRLAVKLNGSITAASRLGQGSTFVLTLPTGPLDALEFLAGPPPAPVEPEPSPLPAARTGKILLAEDNPDNQRLIKRMTGLLQASLTVAGNGQEAVEQALAQEFDLILMDVQMPVMDGVTATKWLRRAGCRKPIIALTANVLQEDLETYLAAGFDGVLAKPIDRSAFYSLLETHLPATTDETPSERFADSAAFRSLADGYRLGLPQWLAHLDTALDGNDWLALQSLVHQLKGTAGSFGFADLSMAATAIDDRFRAGDRDALRDDLAKLRRQVLTTAQEA